MINENGFQGRFTSTGSTAIIDFPTDIQWMEVINGTAATAGGGGTAVRFYWQKGLGDGYGFVNKKLAADDSITMEFLAGCFTFVNSYGEELSAPYANAITDVSAANPPVVTANNTAGLADYDTIRFGDLPGAAQFAGIDFTVDTINPNVSFRLPFAPQIVGTGAILGTYSKVVAPDAFYPRRKYISKISQANPGVITTTSYHEYTVGQKIRIHVPAEYGMTEINGMQATITAISAANATITTDINTAGFTAFAWPLTAVALAGVTAAHIVPVGEDGLYNLSLDDRVNNTSTRYMMLAGGADGPGGANNDVMYWRAGRSLTINNV